jgi:hypothetical protein
MIARVVAGLVLILPGAAAAQTAGLFDPSTFHAVADLRVGKADGEESWVSGGFGKTDLANDWDVSIPRAAVTWQPRLGFAWNGRLTLRYQEAGSPEVDVNEAYVGWRAPPAAFGRFSARAGLFYPPISLEHTTPTWTSPDMLSASAINSWIGEEVLVRGLEATLRRDFGEHEVAVTASAFGWNDPNGSLLGFRGWTLHGLTAGADTRWVLPPLSVFMSTRQPPFTTPGLEMDEVAGWYGRVEWRLPNGLSLEALHYVNPGKSFIVTPDLEWSGSTRFTNLGAHWEINERTTLTAQALWGEALMEERPAGLTWRDMTYASAYVRVQRKVGEDTLSGRLDWFEVDHETLRPADDADEDGWAATLAWRHRLADHLDLIVEAQHIDSDRPARYLAGEAAGQEQTALSAALRVSF